MIDMSQASALRRLLTEFDRRRWRDDRDVALQVVRRVAAAGGVINPKRIVDDIPREFRTRNNIPRSELEDVIQQTFSGVRIVADRTAASSTVNLTVTGGDLVVGRNIKMDKRIEINNQGQMNANIDSPGARVNVGRQQQVQVSASQMEGIRQHWDDPEAQEIIASDLPTEEKASKLGAFFSGLLGIGKDVATNVATDVLTGKMQW